MVVEVQDVYLQKFSLNKLPIRELSPYSPYDNFQTIEVSIQNIVLNELLPDFWSIVQTPNTRIHTDPHRKHIVVPDPYFNLPGNIFSLLHEIGHGILDDKKDEVEIEEEIFLRDKYSQLGSSSLSSKEKARFEKLVVGSEKWVWEWAIKTTIHYHDKGFDLEPSLTKSDLRKIANQKLSSYLR